MEPVLVTYTPPVSPEFWLVEFAIKVTLAPGDEVKAPVMVMLRVAEMVDVVVMFRVPMVTSLPLLSKVMLPAPITGVTLSATPPDTDRAPPEPGEVSSTALTMMAVIEPMVLFAASR